MLQAHAQEFLKRGGGRILDCWGIFEISYLSPCKIRFQLIFSVERVETQVRGGGGGPGGMPPPPPAIFVIVSCKLCPPPEFLLLLVANWWILEDVAGVNV